MNLEIYKSKPIEKKEQLVRLVLEKDEGDIVVMVVDENGNGVAQGDLIYINADGTISLAEGVHDSFGFQLDSHGSIVLEEI